MRLPKAALGLLPQYSRAKFSETDSPFFSDKKIGLRLSRLRALESLLSTIYRTFPPHFHVHFTPIYGSWINLVERWFAELTNKRIRRGVFRSVKELESASREFIEIHNEDPTPFVWTRSADQILASIARYAQRTLSSSGLIVRTTGTGD